MNCILAIPRLLETGCAEFCFRTFSLVQENGFVPEKHARRYRNTLRNGPSSLKAGAAKITSRGLWGLNPEGWLSVTQVCEALNTREGRNAGTDATQ